MPGSRNSYFIFAIAAAHFCMPSVSFARDELEAIVRKDKLSSADVATIETVVRDRAKKLSNASKNPKQLRDTRNALIATAKVSKASQAGLDAYALACSSELISTVTQDELQLGLEAVQVLVELNHANCAEALSAALRSTHPAVRYRAAIGIRALHARIKDNRAACRSALASLAGTGALEENDVVLRAIYQAIDFKASVPNFQNSDDAAGALIDVFAGRINQLARGSRDEWKDTVGFESAANCFADATAAHKADLVVQLARFLAEMVGRYQEPDTSPDYIPTLQSTTKTLESTLQKFLKSANLDAPSNPVSGKMATTRTESSKGAVQAGYTEWIEAFKKSPWPIS